MSFDYNPLEHVEIVTNNLGDGYEVYCHGCGAQIPLGGNLDVLDIPIHDAFIVMRRHVETSHKRTDADFKGWSKI